MNCIAQIYMDQIRCGALKRLVLQGIFAAATLCTAGLVSAQTVTPIYTYTANYDGAGNVLGYSDLVMGTWNFSYDSLNRLSSGAPSTGSYAGQYFCWAYDSFGNRTSQSQQSSACSTGVTSTATYNANNQVTWTTVNVAASGLSYDAAGNVTYDGVISYLYDAEGRICAVKNAPVGSSSVIMVGYVYDANGARVAKGAINAWSCDPSVNGFTTTSDYVLDTSGAQVTEMSVSGGASTWSHTNVWGSGKLLATYDMTGKGMHYYLDDPLGSRRVQTDYAGVVEQTCSSLPFGDALSCTGSKTTPTEHHYTGKERDAESGNDYFGARYYASSMGRMLSPDPSQLVYADQMNPQSLNLYSYVLNNPLINTDPTGMECVWDDGSYDSNDDPDTGSKKKCEGGSMGGHWVDHSFFQNANDNGANLPDWSSKPNSSIDLNSPLGLVTLLATCTDTILDAINAQFAQTGLDMTTDNVTDNFYYHGAVNIDISATNLSSGQYNSIHAGRYRNPNGSDSSPSLHLPKGPGGSDSPQTIPFSNPKNGTISATAHIDSALAGLFHPSGTLQHYKTDVQGSGANRSPCPSGDQK